LVFPQPFCLTITAWLPTAAWAMCPLTNKYTLVSHRGFTVRSPIFSRRVEAGFH
jgi:hypothetical protein